MLCQLKLVNNLRCFAAIWRACCKICAFWVKFYLCKYFKILHVCPKPTILWPGLSISWINPGPRHIGLRWSILTLLHSVKIVHHSPVCHGNQCWTILTQCTVSVWSSTVYHGLGLMGWWSVTATKLLVLVAKHQSIKGQRAPTNDLSSPLCW